MQIRPCFVACLPPSCKLTLPARLPAPWMPTESMNRLRLLLLFSFGLTAFVQAEEPPARSARSIDKARSYWAYQPVREPAAPSFSDAWAAQPIDAFIWAKLNAKGLKPNPSADRISLLRRLYYDLTGLPPTPKQVSDFVSDPSPDAYERTIDRLLDSPQYGEKWGRHWLDLVRYAETNGYERDGPKPFAWRYRDYVIRSFNQDKPFDRFIREQLAGDEMTGDDPDRIIATGFYRLGLWDDEPADPKQARYDEFDDMITTVTQVFLGMTLNCARCHDHKIDPLPQSDYYGMLAFFRDIQPFSNDRNTKSSFNLTDITPKDQRSKYEVEFQAREDRKARIVAAMTKLEDAAIRKMPVEDQRAAEGLDRPLVVKKVKDFLSPTEWEEYSKLKADLAKLNKAADPHRELALSVNNCRVRPEATHVLHRGNPHSPGAKVEPAFPAVLGAAKPTIPEPGPGARSSGRRTVLANWIAGKDNPLTARVIVNRVWQHHFGRGIVPTTNDFGKFGVPPTHPELLDWLAANFVRNGWKLKPLHKMILLSNAYRMSSQANEPGLRIDPANELFWRFNPRRLTAEEIRDSMLAVSGSLNLKAGGPSVYPVIPREVLAGQSRPGEGWGKSPPEEANRRSVYVYVQRSLLVPILSAHDQADTDSTCAVRYTTTVPTQALTMLNGDFSQEQATAFAQRLEREAPRDLSGQVRLAIRLTTARDPGAGEVERDVQFLQSLRANARSPQDALKQYCLMLLNTNEFVYVD